jgi:hypothetical protein
MEAAAMVGISSCYGVFMLPDSQIESSNTLSLRTKAAPLWLRTGFWICIAIAVAVVIRRLAALVHPSQSAPPQLAELDAVFASHAALTIMHIVPALVLVVLLPLFYSRRFARAMWVHWLLFVFGAVVGLTAYAMSILPVGGWLERSAVLCFDSLYLYSLARSFGYMRRGELWLERRWMTRAMGILLGIATTRPVMGVFFATSRLTHLEPRQFFGMAFWIGFSINTIVVELWLRSQAGRARA